MDADVTKAFADLEKRVSYQEHLHRNIDATPQGFLHGVVTNLPAIIVAVGLSAIVAIVIVNYSKKNS
jgi:hypothetical protein